MAILGRTHFEFGHDHAEGLIDTGVGSYSTAQARTGSRSYLLSATSAAEVFRPVATTPGLGVRHWAQQALYIPSSPGLPTNNVRLFRWQWATEQVVGLALKPNGKLQLTDSGATFGSESSVTIATDTWYVIEMGVEIVNGNDYAEVRVNGVQELISDGALNWRNIDGISRLYFGIGDNPGGSFSIHLDDLALNDENGSVNNSWVDQEKIAVLFATADSQVDGWAGGGGSTSNLYEAVNNVPPAGLDNGSATNTSQIECGNADTADNYDATMQTYSAVGIPGGSTITSIQPIIVGSNSSTTGSDTVGVSVLSNPSISEDLISVDVNDGTYPTGWNRGPGTLVDNPSVTLGAAPVMQVRKGVSTTRVATVCLMAMVVSYIEGDTETYERTVPQSAAIRTTLTRTIPQSARISVADNARTVPQSAAIRTTLTRTVPQSAAVRTTLTRTVPESAAILTTLARTVPESAHIKVVDIARTVPQSAAIGAVFTRAVPQSAAVLTTLTRTAPQSAYISTPGLTRTVPQSAHVKVSDLTRTVPQSAALRLTFTRIIPESAAIQVTLTRTVPQSAAVQTTSERTVPQSAIISLAAPRVVPQSAAIRTTTERPVPQSAAILATFARIVPQSASISVANIARTVPQSAAVRTTLTRTIPQSAVLRTTEARTVPQSAAVLSTQARTVPQSAAVAHTFTRIIPQSAALRASHERSVPQEAAILLTLARTVPQSAAIAQVLTRTVPQSAAINIALTRMVPQSARISVLDNQRIVPQAAHVRVANLQRVVPQSAVISEGRRIFTTIY